VSRNDRVLTAKQEAFACNIVEGDGPSDAYRRAYAAMNMSAESISVEAARLMQDARIVVRIAELRDSMQRALGVSRAGLVREIDDILTLARDRNDPKAALACIMAKATILGFLALTARPTSPSERRTTIGLDIEKVE
jgi:hypothetical protein